ncbi:MAG TPA: HAMP domain-containing sensor histidine kinase [Conexibacter sp.]|nr:HAMP domain-containing sensor histidine kinase [Conexibacter sp.]
MASRGSSTRSAARATSSARSALAGVWAAYRRLPTRWRLAGGSAALTFVILLGFAAIVGLLTTRQIRVQFDDSVRQTANYLQSRASISFNPRSGAASCGRLGDLASGEDAKVRVYLLVQPPQLMCEYGGANPASPRFSLGGSFPNDQQGYRVEIRQVNVDPIGTAVIVYARPLSAIDRTAAKVRFFLILGVLGGSGLALLAGLMVARRAMAPIAALTASAREIERTRDPGGHVPQPEADDEVAELARTLEDMLQALDAARDETEATLERQREFVADASHELRTPLTSVLANLELLAEQVEGEDAQAAVGSALRSSRRMRRLVADLLLLARYDRSPPTGTVAHRPVDLARVLVDVAGELEPVTGGHHLTIAAPEPLVVEGALDELHRLALNLIENALRHTPPGTHVHASLARAGEEVVLTVEDDGPGIPPELRPRLFERFVRGRGDGGGGGSGLGLSIVRAVALSHGGAVDLERGSAGTGARFVVRLPRSGARAPEPAPAAGA